jgi:CO/xanthine dehydrogenase Mo-binding subunit
LTENAIEQFASLAHDEWRRSLPPNEQNEPRMRSKNGGPKADINVPFDQLHPTAQQENLAAGQAAAEAVSKFPNNLEQAAEYIHIEWMKRNPQDDYNAAQHKSYDELPEDEKEKDRVHVRTMMKLMRK